MATTMEQRAKFRELRTSGVSREEAQTQAYGNIAPVVPPAPVALDVNSDANRLARLQASGGSPTAIANLQEKTTPAPVVPVQTTPVAPAPIVQAPVDQTTGLSKPLEATPAPVDPVTPIAPTPATTPKVEPVIDYTQAQGREQEIKNNVQSFIDSKMTPEQVKQASGYAQATPEKKAIIDGLISGANAPILMNQKDIVTALIGGQSVPVQKTQAYNNAVVIADMFKKFNGMTPVQLLDNLKQGQIGTELDSLLSQNPNYAQAKAELAKAQKTASINRSTAMATGVISGKETPVVDDLANIEAKYNPPIGANEQAYIDYVTKNSDVITAGSQVKQLSNQINTLTTTYNDALKSLKAQYGDMPASALLTLMGSRTNDTKELLDSYINAKELAKGDFDLAMKMAEGHYNATSKDIAEQQQIAGEQRQVQAQKDMMQYKSDFEKKQAEQALNDPAIAISSVIKEFTDMGIPTTQSLQTKIADAQKFIAQGGTLGEYISQMQKDFQAKPEYKAKFGEKETQYGFSNLGDGRIAITNPKTGQVSFANAGNVSSANAPTTTSANRLNVATGTDVGVECGTFARELCGLDATPGGNSLEARQKAFVDKTPTAGGMVLFTGGNYDKTYGHIASIESVNQDGTINVVESNLNGDKKVTRRTLQANDPAISGFYNNTPLAKSSGTQPSQYTDQNINDLAYLVELQEKNPTQAAKDMKELGYTARDLANYKAGNVPMTEKQKNSSIEVMNAIKDLADPSKYEWNDAVGFLAGTPSWSGGDAANAEMAINNLVAKLTLPNLGVLKGPMSDKDIQFIKEASSKLSRNQSDASFERNLIDAYNLSARRSGMPEIEKLSDISGGTPQQTVGGEMDYTQFVPKK